MGYDYGPGTPTFRHWTRQEPLAPNRILDQYRNNVVEQHPQRYAVTYFSPDFLCHDHEALFTFWNRKYFITERLFAYFWLNFVVDKGSHNFWSTFSHSLPWIHRSDLGNGLESNLGMETIGNEQYYFAIIRIVRTTTSQPSLSM
jgi:hypothetical protein